VPQPASAQSRPGANFRGGRSWLLNVPASMLRSGCVRCCTYFTFSPHERSAAVRSEDDHGSTTSKELGANETVRCADRIAACHRNCLPPKRAFPPVPPLRGAGHFKRVRPGQGVIEQNGTQASSSGGKGCACCAVTSRAPLLTHSKWGRRHCERAMRCRHGVPNSATPRTKRPADCSGRWCGGSCFLERCAAPPRRGHWMPSGRFGGPPRDRGPASLGIRELDVATVVPDAGAELARRPGGTVCHGPGSARLSRTTTE
jgi:hypothetical protein